MTAGGNGDCAAMLERQPPHDGSTWRSAAFRDV
jgi:hypothetical protein